MALFNNTKDIAAFLNKSIIPDVSQARITQLYKDEITWKSAGYTNIYRHLPYKVEALYGGKFVFTLTMQKSNLRQVGNLGHSRKVSYGMAALSAEVFISTIIIETPEFKETVEFLISGDYDYDVPQKAKKHLIKITPMYSPIIGAWCVSGNAHLMSHEFIPLASEQEIDEKLIIMKLAV
jgi:hypothetical protein